MSGDYSQISFIVSKKKRRFVGRKKNDDSVIARQQESYTNPEIRCNCGSKTG
jgi:hypothetical protein